MRTINLDVKLPKSMPEAELKHIQQVGILNVFGAILGQGVSSIYPEGKLPIFKGKIFAAIQNKIDEADPSDVELELEDSQYDFIKTLFLDDNLKYRVEVLQLACKFMDKVLKE